MSELPTLNHAEIRAHVGARSFERALDYFEEGAIFGGRRQGDTLTARCQGSRSEAYHVRVTLSGKHITDAECSCPVGEDGRCKHVAALLLTWSAYPERFISHKEITSALDEKSKEELIAIIQAMLRASPELARFLEGAGEATPGETAEEYRSRASRYFEEVSGAEDWESVEYIGEGLISLVEEGDTLVEEGSLSSAAEAYEAIAETIFQYYEEADDEYDTLDHVVDECAEGLGRCLAGTQDAEARERLLRSLFAIRSADDTLGGYNLGAAAATQLKEHATPEERRVVAGWAREAMESAAAEEDEEFEGETKARLRVWQEFLFEIEGETLPDEEFLRLCRELHRPRELIGRLLDSDRIEEAVAEARHAEGDSLLGFARIFDEHGQGELVERLVLEQARKSKSFALLEWLKERFTRRGDLLAALDAAEELFRQSRDGARYRQVRELAQAQGVWEDVRPELLPILRQRSVAEYIRVQLEEGAVDQALAALPEVDSYSRTQLERNVARAAEESHPREALEIYRRHVAANIAYKNRGRYQEACQALQRIRRIYERLGEGAVWEEYVAALRRDNERLKAFQEELGRAGL